MFLIAGIAAVFLQILLKNLRARSLIPGIILTALLIIGTYAFWSYTNFSGLNQFKAVLDNPSLENITFIGGRRANYTLSWQALTEHLWVGIGWSHFFHQARLKLAIHNIPMQLLIGFGISALLPILYLLLSYMNAIIANTRKGLEATISILILVFTFLCLLPDHYINYSSMFSATTLILILAGAHKSKALSGLSVLIISLTAVFAGCLSAYDPPKPLGYASAHAKEKDDSGRSYHWFGSYQEQTLKAGQCMIAEITIPPHPFGRNKLIIAPIEQQASKFAKLKDLKQLVSGGKDFEISGSEWQTLCICQNAYAKKISILAEKGEYLSISRGSYSRTDDRWIAYGLSKATYTPKVNIETEKCVYYVEL
jgi:hypothetical protein